MSKFNPESNGRLANGEFNPCFLATKQKFDYVGFFYQTIADLWGYYTMDVNDDIFSRDHCFNDDGYSYEFEMQVAMDKDGNEIEELVEQEVSCNKFLRRYYWDY